jgi:hypothetical protein
MPTTGAFAFTPSGRGEPLIASNDALAPPSSVIFQARPMDVDLSAHYRVISNAVNCELLKLSNSHPTTNLPREDRLFHTRDLASANRFLLILDEKFRGKTWNSHQE